MVALENKTFYPFHSLENKIMSQQVSILESEGHFLTFLVRMELSCDAETTHSTTGGGVAYITQVTRPFSLS